MVQDSCQSMKMEGIGFVPNMMDDNHMVDMMEIWVSISNYFNTYELI